MSLKRLLLMPLIILMLFPWTKLTSTFNSDVQPYSLIYGLGFLPAFGLIFATKGNWRMSKTEVYTALTSIALFAESFILLAISEGDDALRGVYQYFNGAVFFMITFFLLRYRETHKDSRLIYRLTLLGFLAWVFVGIVQLTHDRAFATNFVNRSVLTNDRGAISLSSEPGYFGYTLIFFTIFFALYGKKHLAVLAALLIPILTMSAASLASLALLCIILLTYRYGFRSLLYLCILGVAAYYFGSLIVRHPELASYRAANLLKHLYDDRSTLLLDGSLNIRLVHIYYSHYGFIENLGVPHGVTNWPIYLSERIGEFSLLWDSGLDQTSRINSGMGGILFEGGYISIFPLVFIALILRNASTSRKQFALYVAIFIYLFYVGFNFRTPFLYLLIIGVLIHSQPKRPSTRLWAKNATREDGSRVIDIHRIQTNSPVTKTQPN